MKRKIYRSAVTGKLVSKEYAEANPDTTVAETVEAEETEETKNEQISDKTFNHLPHPF